MRRIDFLRSLGVVGASFSLMNYTDVYQRSALNNLPNLLVDEHGRAITTVRQWKRQREVIRKRWSDFLGVLKDNPAKPELKVVKEDRPEGLIRQLVTYESEPGITVKGYLIRPEVITKPVPGIVAMHSTSDTEMEYIAGVKQGKIVPFGYRLARQGFVVFCPQCYLMHNKGDLSYEQIVQRFHDRHPASKGMAKMLFDAKRAVDVLVSLPEVDSRRIGATGHSLGAKEVFYLGAFDDRVKAIVSNEGGIGIDFSNWDAIWYLSKEVHDFKYKHHELLAAVAPKPFLLIGGDSADGEQSRPYVAAVKPVYGLYGEDENIRLLNHASGHGVTSEAERQTYQWLKKNLS